MRIRALEGLNRGSSGRYVHIKELNKIERQTLRSTFSVVKDVQLMLTSRYRIDFLR
jgi:CBS domain-containing protein